MHVVVGGSLLGCGPSGANRRLLSLLEAVVPLLGSGEEVTALVPSAGTPLPAGIRSHVAPIPAGPTWRRAVAERLRLPRLLVELRASVYEHGLLPVPRRLHCPVSLTLHDLRDVGEFRRRPRPLVRWLLRRGLQHAGHVTVPSEFTAAALRAACGNLTPPLTVIPGGVGEAFIGLRRQPAARDYFLHVGHLEPRKNLVMLLSAYAQFVDQLGADADPPRLVLAGLDAGAGRALHERASFLDVAGLVEFTGQVSERALAELYAGARALCMPSHEEGFGLTVLEALAAGCPVLAADAGALPELVGDVAALLPPDDPGAWARAMQHVVGSDPMLGTEDRRAHAARFSWQRTAEATLGVWRRLDRSGRT